MSRRAAGAASRTASTRWRSSLSPPSFSLRIGRFEFAFAEAAILSGVSRLIVNDVSTPGTIGMFANSQTGLPERFAPKSQSAQSNARSEEHTSELQSPYDLVCRLLLEKKNKIKYY